MDDGAAGLHDGDAPYHVLLTIKAMKENPIEAHYFLPIVTLNGEKDKNIPWGAAIPTPQGNYIYTSFTSPGFFLPYIVFDFFNCEPTLTNLSYFNFSLQYIISNILFIFLLKILLHSGYNLKSSLYSAALGTTAYIFSSEALKSHGIIYWPHSFSQLLLISALFLFFNILTDENNKKLKNIYSYFFITITFLYALTEWTGYIFGLGVATVLIFTIKKNLSHKILFFKVIFSLFLAGILTFIHFGYVIGFYNIVSIWIKRFFARTITSGKFSDLYNGYIDSLGIFLFISSIYLIIYGLHSYKHFKNRENRTQDTYYIDRAISIILIVATFPILENFLMLNHAILYTFDRLKVLFPCAIAISLCCAAIKENYKKTIFTCCIIMACIHGYLSYKNTLADYSIYSCRNHQNILLVNAVKATTNLNCAIISTNTAVRGYYNLIFNKSIVEFTEQPQSLELLKKFDACSSIFLNSVQSYFSFPYILEATITNKNNESFKLTHIANTAEFGSDFYLTNSDWTDGISKQFAGFFVPNITPIRAQFNLGDEIVFKNGDIRKVIQIIPKGRYLHIQVEGKILNPKEVGSPASVILKTYKTSVS